MRTCQSCGKENPDDQDFCSCGEYLRWEPTGYAMPAITPDQVAAAGPASGARLRLRPCTPAPALVARARQRHGNGHALPAAPPPPPPPAASPRRRRSARPAPDGQDDGAQPAGRARPPGRARRPGPRWRHRRRRAWRTAATSCPRSRRRSSCARPSRATSPRAACSSHASSPGERGRVLALIRNQSGIVDNYDLRVEGMPGRLVVDLPRHGLPRAVRRRRDLRAGGRGPPAPAAHARGRGAAVGAQGRRGLQGEPDRRRLRAAAPAHRRRTSRRPPRCARSVAAAAARPPTTST